MTLKKHEKEIIRRLIGQKLSEKIIGEVLASPNPEFEHTGVGYYIDLSHDELPIERMVFDKPMIIGVSNGIETGYIVFVENKTLTLECYLYGGQSLSQSYRDESVEVRAEGRQ